MAAIDLERGLEHSGRGWGQERPELMDNFDSEMQEWEDQLQDIQRKIEEVKMEAHSQAAICSKQQVGMMAQETQILEHCSGNSLWLRG